MRGADGFLIALLASAIAVALVAGVYIGATGLAEVMG